MAEAAEARFFTRWTSRESLAFAALEPGRVLIDGQSPAERLAAMVRDASGVPFVNLADVEEGSWRDLLEEHPAILLALLATLDISGSAAEAETLIARIRASHDWPVQEPLLRELARLLLGIAAGLDPFLVGAQTAEPGTPSREVFEAFAVQALAPVLRRLLTVIRCIEHRGWFEESVIVVVAECRFFLFVEVDVELWPEQDLPELVAELLDVAGLFLETVLALIDAAKQAVEQGPGADVAPDVALLFAFADIFRHSAASLNALPLRVAEYYRSSVVRIAPEAASPDSLFAAITPLPASGGPPIHLAAGTIFPAGRGADGQVIGFASDQSVTLANAAVTQVRVAAREPCAGRTATRLRAETFALPPDGKVAAVFTPGAALPDAALGLVATSPLLELRSGRRSVSLFLNRLRFRRAPHDAALTSADLQACFTLSVTTEAGWTPVTDFSARLLVEDDGPALLVSFELGEGFAPVIQPASGVPGETAGPALRLMLVQDAIAYGVPALALLSGIAFGDATLTVGVAGLGELRLTTPDGPAAAAPGVAPFGTAPLPGAALRIDHPAFAQSLDAVTLELDWSNLPTDGHGFLGYYRQYVVGPGRWVYDGPLFTNASFSVDLIAPLGGVASISRHPLFAPAEGPLRSSTVLEPLLGDTADPAGAAAASDTAITVTLRTPPFGFGDALYPVNVARATALLVERTRAQSPTGDEGSAASESRGKVKRFWQRLTGGTDEHHEATVGDEAARLELAPREPLRSPGWAALPNPPWRPTLSDLRVSYTATAATLPPTNGNRLHLFHVEPFGEMSALAGPGGTLLPPVPESSFLDLRISGWQGQDALALLFLLGPPVGGAERPVVRWGCRTASGWAPLDTGDGTYGLTATGILTLPPMDTGGSDIRVRAVFASLPPAISQVLPNALSATRRITGTETELQPVPPGTLRGPVGITGIARVEQPLPSFGGSPAGDVGDALQRLAGRISTRDRSLYSEDLERLALGRFRDASRVRVEPAGGNNGWQPSGHLRVTLLPVSGGPTPPDPLMPTPAPELRAAVAAFLRSVSSPFARIEVVDPVYAPVDINILAAFAGGGCGPDRLLADLKAILSPWSEPALAMPDEATLAELNGALARFVTERSYVDALVSIETGLPGPPPADAAFPVPGSIAITSWSPTGGGC